MSLVATAVWAGTAVSPLGITEDRASSADLDASTLTKAYVFIAPPCGDFGACILRLNVVRVFVLYRSGHGTVCYGGSAGIIVVSACGFADGVAFVAHRVVAYNRVGSCGGRTA